MRHGRRDSTHKEVRDCLRELGATVFDTGDVGGSFPDLVVGFRGRTHLVEVKGPKTKVSDGQSAFASVWMGAPVVVLRSHIEARGFILGLMVDDEMRKT